MSNRLNRLNKVAEMIMLALVVFCGILMLLAIGITVGAIIG